MAESKDSTILLSGSQILEAEDPETIGDFTLIEKHPRKPILYVKDKRGKQFVLKRHDYIDFDELPGYTQREINQACFDHECEIHTSLHHPNICPAMVMEHRGVKYLLMPKVGRADLFYALPMLEKDKKLVYLEQIASALAYCHEEKGIVHNDIKMENVRVGDIAYLLDFGSARRIGEKDKILLATLSLTERTAAPEYINRKIFNPRSDTFSFSYITYAALTGCEPFKHRSERIVYNQPAYDANKMEEYGNAGKLIIQGLSLKNEARPSVKEIGDALRELTAKYNPQPSEQPSEPCPVLVQ